MLVKIHIENKSKGVSLNQTLHCEDTYLTLGREKCDVIIDDSSCSRTHAILANFCDVGLIVQDLGSTNGTLVNGKAIEKINLKSGDVIQIGLTTVTILSALSKGDMQRMSRKVAKREEEESFASRGVMIGWPYAMNALPRRKQEELKSLKLGH